MVQPYYNTANVGPWKKLATSHKPPLTWHTWKAVQTNPNNPYSLSYNAALSGLSALLTPRTRNIALSGCSNILGELFDIKEAVRIVRDRSPNAWVVIDLVAYAP